MEDGSVEVWKFGRVEVWKSGSVEGGEGAEECLCEGVEHRIVPWCGSVENRSVEDGAVCGKYRSM